MFLKNSCHEEGMSYPALCIAWYSCFNPMAVELAVEYTLDAGVRFKCFI